MIIERIDLFHIKIPLLLPFETSYGRDDDMEKLLLKVYTPDMVTYAECVAETTPTYSYETIGTAREILKKYLFPLVLGKEIDGPEEYCRMVSWVRGHEMARSALENSVWILKALEKGVSLAQLLGGTATKIVSGVSIGIQDTVESLVDLVGSYLEKGYPRIKIKIKPGKDIQFIEGVRKRYPDIALMVDANNAYSLDDIDILKEFDRYNLTMAEQPLDYDDIIDHARLRTLIETPICLDESIHSPYFARVAAELNACQIINIKQARVGGLRAAKIVHDLCMEHNIGVWCGGMMETGIGRAVNIALTTLANFIYPSDISASDRYWERDIIEQPFVLNTDGTIDVPSGAGLGVTVDEKMIDRYTISHEVFRA